MDRETAKRVDDAVRAAIANAVEDSFNSAGISRSALADSTDIPRETLRRKMQLGDLTVPQMYAIAPLLDAEPTAWVQIADTAAAEARA